MPNLDGSYTTSEVRDLINVSTLAARLESIELRSKDNWSDLKEHIHSEDVVITKIYDKINELNNKMNTNSDQLYSCREEVENKVKGIYVTKEQLEIAMQKNTEILSKLLSDKFESFAKRMEELNKFYKEDIQELKDTLRDQDKAIEENRSNINKYFYIGSGIVIAVSIAWTLFEKLWTK